MNKLPETIKQWALNTTLHGCRHLAEDNRHWLEKILWWLVQVVAFWGMITTILDVYNEYMQSPVVTSLGSNQYPIWLVPFPAVALCNVNKISHKRAKEFAAELISSQTQSNLALEKLTKDLRNLGQIYDTNISGFTGIQDLSYVLHSYKSNMTGLLDRLAPSCDELLVRCQWKGKSQPCLQLFRQMATIHGICCVFNDGNINGKKPEILHSTGPRAGLQVLVDPQPGDYFYPVLPTYGTQMYIFKPFDYPDAPNGMIEYVISKQREMFYNINIFSRFTTPELQVLSTESRGCHYLKETHANCLSACVFEMMLETCRCLPYYAKNPSHAKVCDLTDIPCLSRNKGKFEHYNNGDGSTLCPHCLPACTDTWYDVQSSYAEIVVPQPKSRFSILEGLDVTENHSLIHVYYQNLDTTLYKQDVLYTRTELVSSIGGICSLFNGFSFLSLIEIIYFLTMRWYLMDRIQDEENTAAVDERDVNSPAPYWRELGAQHLPLGPPLKSLTYDWETRENSLGQRIDRLSKSYVD